jgi:hypothetical protein
VSADGILEKVVMDGVVAIPDGSATRDELAKVADLLPAVQFDGVVLKAWTTDAACTTDDGTPVPTGSLVARVEVVSPAILRGIDANPSAADQVFAAIGTEAVSSFVSDLRKASTALVPVETDDDETETEESDPSSMLKTAAVGAGAAWAGLLATLQRIASSQPSYEFHVAGDEHHIHVPEQAPPDVHIDNHAHVLVEARKPTKMRARTNKDGSRVYEPVEDDAA